MIIIIALDIVIAVKAEDHIRARRTFKDICVARTNDIHTEPNRQRGLMDKRNYIPLVILHEYCHRLNRKSMVLVMKNILDVITFNLDYPVEYHFLKNIPS